MPQRPPTTPRRKGAFYPAHPLFGRARACRWTPHRVRPTDPRRAQTRPYGLGTPKWFRRPVTPVCLRTALDSRCSGEVLSVRSNDSVGKRMAAGIGADRTHARRHPSPHHGKEAMNVSVPPFRRRNLPAVAALLIPTACLFWAFWPTFVELVEQWNHNPQYSHGYLVPVFAAVLLWLRRDRLDRAALRPSWWGLAPLAAGSGAPPCRSVLLLHLVRGNGPAALPRRAVSYWRAAERPGNGRGRRCSSSSL